MLGTTAAHAVPRGDLRLGETALLGHDPFPTLDASQLGPGHLDKLGVVKWWTL